MLTVERMLSKNWSCKDPEVTTPAGPRQGDPRMGALSAHMVLECPNASPPHHPHSIYPHSTLLSSAPVPNASATSPNASATSPNTSATSRLNDPGVRNSGELRHQRFERKRYTLFTAAS